MLNKLLPTNEHKIERVVRVLAGIGHRGLVCCRPDRIVIWPFAFAQPLYHPGRDLDRDSAAAVRRRCKADQLFDAGFRPVHRARITSYNVCYTKLLRIASSSPDHSS